ncbi:MAG: GspE/PulE family protein [Bacteroidota bacterium]
MVSSLPTEIDYRILSLLSPEQAHHFQVVPFQMEQTGVSCLAGPETHLQLPRLELLLGQSLQLEPLSQSDIQAQLARFYPLHQAKASGVSKTELSDSDAVRFVQKMIEEAAQMGASDIHVEQYEGQARVRFRWEGQLIEKYEIPLGQYNAIISRIKILAELDIAERRLPQDGRIPFSVGDTQIDLRVSTIPGKKGEKAVMRLLTRSSEHLDLQNLGLPEWEARHYQRAIQRPNGIVLITGPTGSGKTTTLYATLNQLNTPTKNILTIEDPVEYKIQGINQVQLKEGIGLTFDRALRAFLRQDPDIIMVGEIRDTPTAQIAIRAALTGHLVFSTLHTNSAWDAITRLRDMGTPAYLLAASLRLVVAQRLVRVLCPQCKSVSQEIQFPQWQERYQLSQHFHATGCPACYFTGYRGRKAVFEVLPISREVASLIKSGAEEVHEFQTREGMPSLSDNLAQLVASGETSLAEAMMHVMD